MSKFSPNWYWQELGFTVEREGKYKIRTVRDSFGRIVCRNAGHEGEISIAKFLHN